MHSRIIYISTKQEVEKYSQEELCEELSCVSNEMFEEFADYANLENEEDHQETLEWLNDVFKSQLGNGINYNEENGEFTIETYLKDEFKKNKVNAIQTALDKFSYGDISLFELKQVVEDKYSFRYVLVEDGKMEDMRFNYPVTIEDLICDEYLKAGKTYKVFGTFDYHY